ncbi:hypothetical protein QG083_01360 [Kingella kingae]|uniref:Membrane protein n=2 Tax=Kingella kingae TaxID=504 RepID=F5S5M5_KINKI|nr:hypothetical protein [Kingella kingae]EGK10996.1 membrane protein [Kingella kingae ATCC 23330]EIC14271.1 membrane protein [Kingella kingae PYKK081]MBD3613468.1 hypothetical protein [Kingella kingae]MBD3631865.1 hypothetical protein [Kingella kingae]MBD3659208.1 hypothetical protein [Kingella kingae]
MSNLDYAALFLLSGIALISFTVLWQMYVVLSEIYTLDRYKDSPKLGWIAAAIFFSFSLAIYYFCPNSRKKGLVFLLSGALGVLCYGLGMWFKNQA